MVRDDNSPGEGPVWLWRPVFSRRYNISVLPILYHAKVHIFILFLILTQSCTQFRKHGMELVRNDKRIPNGKKMLAKYYIVYRYQSSSIETRVFDFKILYNKFLIIYIDYGE